jgi:hypothetical protein
MAVVGKQVAELRFLAVILGDEPALETELSFYQRLLAGDEDEAGDILEAQLRKTSRAQAMDEVVLPALRFAGRDRAQDLISAADHEALVRLAGRVVERAVDVAAPEGRPRAAADVALLPPRRVLGIPARDAVDELVLRVLARLLEPGTFTFEPLGAASLASEAVAELDKAPPDLVVITSMPPGGLASARYACKRLRARAPAVPIVVLRPPGEAGPETGAARLGQDGATVVAATTVEVVERATQLALLGADRLAPLAARH